jgi:hypothetical protein
MSLHLGECKAKTKHGQEIKVWRKIYYLKQVRRTWEFFQGNALHGDFISYSYRNTLPEHAQFKVRV